MRNMVSCEWLLENINNEKLVLVDCRFDLMDKTYGRVSFEKGHIEGAVRVDLETKLADPKTEHGGRHPLPSSSDLKLTFEEAGISNDSIVVAYDGGDLSGPSRLWWILKYLGHENVYILNGGINEFEKIGGKITTEICTTEKGNFEININESMRVDVNYVRENIGKENVAIIDSREYKRYIGEWEPVDPKKGHIPSALSYFWMGILDINDDVIYLKDNDKLNEHFEALKKYDEVIVYCGSGITACTNSIALSEIGINHKVYPGSFSDWISYEENKIETI